MCIRDRANDAKEVAKAGVDNTFMVEDLKVLTSLLSTTVSYTHLRTDGKFMCLVQLHERRLIGAYEI